MFANITIASKFVRLSKITLIAVALIAAYTGSTRAQSLQFDNPTPMDSDRVAGLLPKGKAIAHFYSFTAGPGELIVSFSFYSESSEWVGGIGGQLTDAYGRAFTNLDAKANDRDKKSVNGDFDASGTTLVGRYSIPRRQTLVLKVYTQTVGIPNDAPVRYRVRVESSDSSSGGNGSAAAQEASGTTTDPAATASRNTTTTRPARTVSTQHSVDLCAAEYLQCTRSAIITKTGVGVCIVRRANCLKNAGS